MTKLLPYILFEKYTNIFALEPREPTLCQLYPVASLPALGPWAPPAERGPSLESIYRASLTVYLCEGNKISSLKKITSPQPVGDPQKEKKSGGLGHVPSVPIGSDGPGCIGTLFPLGVRLRVLVWRFPPLRCYKRFHMQ